MDRGGGDLGNQLNMLEFVGLERPASRAVGYVEDAQNTAGRPQGGGNQWHAREEMGIIRL